MLGRDLGRIFPPALCAFHSGQVLSSDFQGKKVRTVPDKVPHLHPVGRVSLLSRARIFLQSIKSILHRADGAVLREGMQQGQHLPAQWGLTLLLFLSSQSLPICR